MNGISEFLQQVFGQQRLFSGLSEAGIAITQYDLPVAEDPFRQ
jgi:hypothetical protein